MRVLLVSGPVIGVLTGTTACFFVVDLWIQFFKRRGYYNRLIKNTCQMDQAYLVHETMEKPDFYEGQILYEVLEETDRSMTGRVKEYRLAMEGFKEYVELWIHEIKLPVASLRLAIHNQGEKQDPARQKMTGAIHRIQGYLDQILYYVRSENTEKDYRIRYCSLSDLIRAVAMENKDELLGSRIQLEVSVGDIQVLTDEKWLIFILNQLINNSIQYCDREKEEQKMRNALEIGDEIVTIGGIVGRVVTIRENDLIIETGADRNKMKIERWAINTNRTKNEQHQKEVEAAREAAKEKKAAKKADKDGSNKKDNK